MRCKYIVKLFLGQLFVEGSGMSEDEANVGAAESAGIAGDAGGASIAGFPGNVQSRRFGQGLAWSQPPRR